MHSGETSLSNVQILRAVLRLAWPLMLGNFFFSVQIAIDRMFLSQYDPDASAAALASSMLVWLPVIFIQNTGGFVATFVAQYYGAGRFREIGPIVHQALHWSVLAGLVVTLLAFFSEPLMRLTGHDAKLVGLESIFFRCLCCAAMPVAVSAAVSGFFSGRGDTRTVIWMNAVGCLVTAGLDWCWIFGRAGFPEWGITGAGLSTLCGCCASALLGLVLFLRPGFDHLFHTRRHWRWNGHLFRQLLRFGVPNGLQSTFDLIAWTVFTLMVGWFGKAELAATSNIFVVNALFFIPMLGIGQASGIFVGQQLGAGQAHNAERGIWIGLAFTLIFMSTMGLLAASSPEFVLWAFASDKEPEIWEKVAALTPGLLWYVALYSAFDGMNVLLAFSLRGAGDTAFISWLYLACGAIFLALPVYLSYDLGWGFYWAWNFAVLYLVAMAVVIFARFRWGPWREMRVIEPAVLEPQN
jgi:MATE family multidrug resistance protein